MSYFTCGDSIHGFHLHDEKTYMSIRYYPYYYKKYLVLLGNYIIENGTDFSKICDNMFERPKINRKMTVKQIVNSYPKDVRKVLVKIGEINKRNEYGNPLRDKYEVI